MSERLFWVVPEPVGLYHVASTAVDTRDKAEALCTLANAAPAMYRALEHLLRRPYGKAETAEARAALAACKVKP